MSQSLGLGYDPKYEGFDPQYPSPPRVHWLALLIAWIVISSAIDRYVPEKYNGLLQSLVVDGWVFYLCRWIKRLNPEAKSPFWCDVYVVVQLVATALSDFAHLSAGVTVLDYVLTAAWIVLGVATVFLVRSDLEDHYNDREHAGLVLNGALTFFLSFLYFQHHLYEIAQRKRRAEGMMTGDDRAIVLTLPPCLWSTSNNVMQMRPANSIPHNDAIVRMIPGIRISSDNVRAGIGA